MAQPRPHLSKAPIAEAVIELRTLPRPEAALPCLQELAATLQARFPKQTLLREAEVALNLPAVGAPTAEPKAHNHGILLTSADSKVVIRLASDNFAYSRLAPYTSWEEVIQEAFPLWQQYARTAVPRAVSRYAVRYINQMDLLGDDAARYLEALPQPPVSLPQKGFTCRMILDDPQRSCTVVVTQATAPAPPRGTMKLLLDIDVFREGSWAVAEISPASFTPLRELKNQVFFASLTDAAVERYI
ncbi:MAG: TIGR04255 family protein [Terriglobales bacterium]